ncbi:PP2C family protein-serine/threonine phosphatase [Nocardioides dilutus]
MSGQQTDLFDNAPCGYAVLDGSGLVLEANAELLRLLGRTCDEVVGELSLAELVSAGGRIYLDTHVFPILALDGVVRELALDVVHADGTRVPVLLSANVAAQPEPDGSRIRVVILEARDRRRYETDLLESMRTIDAARRDAAELAQTLQRTLIPPTPPAIDGLSIAAAYRPAGDGREVGGDFYDVFQVADHEWLAVIGDVTGKGVAAATVTAFVRHTIRALAMQFRDPSDLLRELNHAMLAHETDRFCTVAVVRVVDEDGEWTATGSVGGHPLPLVRHPDGTVAELGTHGSLVGVIDAPTFATFEHRLGDDLLVLYTDGVTEARRERELFGLERLLPLVATADHDPAAVTTDVVEAVLEYQDGDPRDDIAVLTLARAGNRADAG